MNWQLCKQDKTIFSYCGLKIIFKSQTPAWEIQQTVQYLTGYMDAVFQFTFVNFETIAKKVMATFPCIESIEERITEPNKEVPESWYSLRFDSYEDAHSWATKSMLDQSKYICSCSGHDNKWYWHPIP